MTRRGIVCLFMFLLSAGGTSHGHSVEGFGNLPLAFEPNRGQTDPQVAFLARGAGFQLFVTPTRAVYKLQRDGNASVVRMELVGARREVIARGVDRLAGESHYLTGADRGRWITHIPQFARIELPQVYRGIDLAYYGNASQLEYDFTVSPGADLRAIAIEVHGARRLEIDGEGKLLVHTPSGVLAWKKPVAYQEVGGARRAIPTAYVQHGKNRFGFRVGSYDRRAALVIDPILAYSTLLGGTGHDHAYAIAVDASANAVITGETASSDFPTTAGAYSMSGGGVFVAKLNATGSALEYSTFLGPGRGTGIALQGGNAYVTGVAPASFPVTTGAYNNAQPGDNAFVAKLSPDGSALVYSALFGAGLSQGAAIAVDSAGNAHVTGTTQSPAFPTSAGAFQPTRPTLGQIFLGDIDAFFVKLDPSGSALLYSTYLGSTENDFGESIAVDASGMAYVAGTTTGRSAPWNGNPAATSPFPTTSAAYQPSFTGAASAFVTKFDPGAIGAASVVYSTLLGGNNGTDLGHGVAVDGAGSAYVTGSGGPGFPLTNGAYGSAASTGGAFVTKLDAAGSTLAYSAMIAGAQGRKIALDFARNAFVTGLVEASQFTMVDPLAQFSGGSLFVTKIDASGATAVYSTFIDGYTDVRLGLAVDPFGAAYVAGTAFQTFIATPGAYRGTITGIGTTDAFVTKIVTNQSPVASAGADQSVIVGTSFTLDAGGSFDPEGNTLTYVWRDEANAIVGTSQQTLPLMRSQGVHIFTVTVSDGVNSATASIRVTVEAVLSINLYGPGGERVTSSDGKIDCTPAAGSVCSARYRIPTPVTLTAIPGTGVVFSGWDAPCGGTGMCTVTVADNVTVPAHFEVQQVTLSVSHVGNGKVTSTSPAGIDCGATCSLVLPYGSQVTLKADADPGYVFDGWVVDCTGSTTCTVTLAANNVTLDAISDAIRSVTATFREIELTSLSIMPPTATIAVGEKQRFRVIGTFSDGSARELSADRSVDGSDIDTCGIGRNGTVKCFGQRYATPTVVPEYQKAVSLSAGTSHFCARFADGSVNCEGSPVAGISGATMLGSTSPATCALLGDGTVQCFTVTTAPFLQTFNGTGTPIAIGADGAGPICAVFDNGGVSCAGDPAPVAGVSNATAVVTGTFHACALISDGRVICWGQNDQGQLGRGTTDPIGVQMPADFVLEQQGSTTAPMTDVVSIVSGDYDVCALRRDRTVKCWGRLMGPGSLYPLAQTIQPPAGAVPAAVAAGAFHNCATYSDGRLGCWGYNQANTLGAGNPSSLTPLIIGGMTNLVAAWWESANSTVADITGSGLAVARAAGAATISASVGALSASASVVVVNTPAGTNVEARPVDSATGAAPVSVTFSQVTQIGSTTLTINTTGPMAPGGFQIGSPAKYYEISTTATYAAPITICIGYAGINFGGSSPLLFHFEGSQWMDVTRSVDTVRQVVCGEVSSLSPFALFARANRAPLADAGPDSTIECAAPAGSPVTLDGSRSSDPDGDAMTFDWQGSFGRVAGVRPVVTVPLGTTVATLTVSDGRASATDTTRITVRDTLAPEVTGATATPGVLWPPNHKMTPVAVSISVTDRCDASPRCRIESVASNEPVDGTGDGDTAPDWEITGELTLRLRAERSAPGGGRTYSITARCTDASNNASTRMLHVTVPIHR